MRRSVCKRLACKHCDANVTMTRDFMMARTGLSLTEKPATKLPARLLNAHVRIPAQVGNTSPMHAQQHFVTAWRSTAKAVLSVYCFPTGFACWLRACRQSSVSSLSCVAWRQPSNPPMTVLTAYLGLLVFVPWQHSFCRCVRPQCKRMTAVSTAKMLSSVGHHVLRQ